MVHAGEADGELTIDQGAEMGNPSRIRLSWSRDRARIGGTVQHDTVELVK